MKKFEYTIQIRKIVGVFANDLDEAFDRALHEPITAEDLELIEFFPTGFWGDELDKTPINSKN